MIGRCMPFPIAFRLKAKIIAIYGKCTLPITEFDVRYLNVKCYYLTIGWTLIAETRVVALNMTSHWTFLNIFCDSLAFTCISKLLATWNFLLKKVVYISTVHVLWTHMV